MDKWNGDRAIGKINKINEIEATQSQKAREQARERERERVQSAYNK